MKGAGAFQCPFCEGFEHLTPPEIKALREPDSLPDGPGWRIRVVPNMYAVTVAPAQSGQADPTVDRRNRLFTTLEPEGYHEVVVETPEHETTLSEMDEPDLQAVLEIYRERTRALGAVRGVAHVLLFRNRGERSGASLSHPHAQVLASPVIPRPVKEKADSSLEYLRAEDSCLICDMIREERAGASRIIYDSGDFVTFAPFASRFPFEVWIVPASHEARFENSDDFVLKALGAHLRVVLSMFDRCLGKPSTNMLFFSAPVRGEPALDRAFHWHIELFPRLSRASGYEWGNGYFVNSVSPEAAAARLRAAGKKP